MKELLHIAEELGVHERWLPPVEHARKISGAIARGVCHIEHRGHRLAPLLVFDDGGAMELPSVRWKKTDRGDRLTSVSTEHSSDQTTHYDVCGTIDSIEAALERFVAEERTVGEDEVYAPIEIDGATLDSYLTDIDHMISRMKRRRDEYEQFVAEAHDLLERGVRRKKVEPATHLIADLRSMLEEPSIAEDAKRREFVEKIERVRDIAQFLEYSLSDYKEIALDLLAHIDQIRGGRVWRNPDG